MSSSHLFFTSTGSQHSNAGAGWLGVLFMILIISSMLLITILYCISRPSKGDMSIKNRDPSGSPHKKELRTYMNFFMRYMDFFMEDETRRNKHD